MFKNFIKELSHDVVICGFIKNYLFSLTILMLSFVFGLIFNDPKMRCLVYSSIQNKLFVLTWILSIGVIIGPFISGLEMRAYGMAVPLSLMVIGVAFGYGLGYGLCFLSLVMCIFLCLFLDGCYRITSFILCISLSISGLVCQVVLELPPGKIVENTIKEYGNEKEAYWRICILRDMKSYGYKIFKGTYEEASRHGEEIVKTIRLNDKSGYRSDYMSVVEFEKVPFEIAVRHADYEMAEMCRRVK